MPLLADQWLGNVADDVPSRPMRSKGTLRRPLPRKRRRAADVALSKLGIEPGSTGVLHTWTRQLIFHLHIHYLVPGGGLTPNGLRWKRVADSQFFLPQAALAARFKNRLRQWLQAEHQEQLKQIPCV